MCKPMKIVSPVIRKEKENKSNLIVCVVFLIRHFVNVRDDVSSGL